MVRSRYHFLGFLKPKSLKSLKLFKRIYFSDNKFEKDEARACNNLLLPQTSIIERHAINITIEICVGNDVPCGLVE